MYWDHPMLVIDRSHIWRGSAKLGVSRLPITDTDPEKVRQMITRIAATLKPPDALWYVQPAKPHNTRVKKLSKG